MTAPLLCAALLLLPAQAEPGPKPIDDGFKPDPAWKAMGDSLWFDPRERTVILRARVALTRGPLEHLLCRSHTKEHESILASDAVPRNIHAALLLSGAEVGHPVRYEPRFEPPAGTPIAIELHWKRDGKASKADARSWVKDERSGKPLDVHWVFAGSDLFQDPDTKRMIYSADGGDVITVSNFVSAMLDVPIASSADDNARAFVADTDKIPPEGTPVTVYLRPAEPTKAKEAKEPKPSAKP